MRERKDIVLKPEWPIINFGDGTWGRVVEIKPDKNSDGVDVNIMKIIPGEMLIAIYDIPEDMLDEQRHVRVEIPACMISNVSISPAFPTYWCYLDIFGRACPGTQFLKGYIEAEKFMGMQKMMELKKSENAWLKEGYHKATTNNFKWMKEITSVTDMMSINLNQNPQNQPQVVGPLRTDT